MILADITGGYASFADGKFDTRYPYFKQISTAGSVGISTGANWSLADQPVYNRAPRTTSGGPSNSSVFCNVNSTTATAGASVDISPAGIVITDPATGLLLFDPSQPVMHVVDSVSGSRTFACPNPSGQAVNTNTSTVIASIDPAATHIIGSIRTSYDVSSYGNMETSLTGNAGSDWWSINGSTVLYQEWGEGGTGQAANQVISDKATRVVAQSIVEFVASSGSLLLNERTRILALFNGGQWNPATGGAVANYIRSPLVLEYRLKACVFS